MHPYRQIGPSHFWSTGVAQKGFEAIADLWDPKHALERDCAVVTFGSCFAQHFGRALKQRGYNWLVTEPGPKLLSAESCRKFNYDVFSTRTGNIYTASMLKQWMSWALDETSMPEEVWTSDGRCYDPFRPNIEPDGFANIGEVRASQQRSRRAFATALTDADVLVFTLGLTESWSNADQGYEYPVCPGTVAGTFDGGLHRFVNQDYAFIHSTLADVLQRIRSVNSDVRIVLTVSPVPLTATMSGNHVLVATMESKSILRAVAGSLANALDYVDYLPSFEIISSPAFKGAFFEANQRTVTRAGVEQVMDCFFGSLSRKFGNAPASDMPQIPLHEAGRPVVGERQDMTFDADEIICEELLLEAFAPKI
ncbi:MAG: GSCFA domain-containing protein [Hyphomonadaceae bacterium]